MTPLVRKFWDNVEGYEHVRVTWDDVPYKNHWDEDLITKEERGQIIRDLPRWELDARVKGIPSMGRGLVFQILEWPLFDKLPSNHHNFKRLISMDLGIKIDPTVISYLLHDEENDIIYLNKQVTVLDGSTPYQYIHFLLNHQVKGTPIALPADAGVSGRYTLTEQTVREVLEDEYKLNVIPGAILNPADGNGRINNHKSYGINVIANRLELKKLMIHQSCKAFIDEAGKYHVDEKGKFSSEDDHIDSLRYGVLAIMHGHAELPPETKKTYLSTYPIGKKQKI